MRPVWLAIGWAMVAAAVWLSLTPSPPKVDFEASDKLGHLLGYGTLMFWFSQQGRLGYRSYEILDMCANGLGVLLGWAAALILPKALPGGERETR